MTPQLIIFDFDGTLADTTATILQTYRMAIESMGAPTRSDAECQATIGLPLKEGFRQLYPNQPEDWLDCCVETYHQIFESNKRQLRPQLYPGVYQTLKQLAGKGIQMSVASSRNRASLVEMCEDNGIAGFFSLILGAEDVTRAKPDPQPVLITLERLSQNADQTVVVGDMPVDIAMGHSAGCHTIGVTYGNSIRRALAEAGSDKIIDSFSELLNLII